MNKNLACVIMLLIGTNLIADNSKDMPRTGTYYDYYKNIFVKAAAGSAQFEGKASNGSNSNFNRDIQTLTLGKYLDDNNRISIRKEYSDSLDNTKVDMNTLTYDVLVPYREGGHEGPRPFAGFSYTFAKFSNTANTVKSETVSAHMGVQVPIVAKRFAFEAMYESKISNKGSEQINGVNVTVYKSTAFTVGLIYTFFLN